MSVPECVYEPLGIGPDGERFTATELARGPWDPNAQHGGAPAALLARAIERYEPGPAAHVARLTIELLRPVPLGPLAVRTRMVRPGKKVQLVQSAIVADGAEVARAVGLRIREKPLVLPAAGGGPDRLERGPEAADAVSFERVGPISFGGAMEISPVRGAIDRVGRATVWFRLAAPLVGGEATSPLMRVAAAADFGNGVSAVVDWSSGWLFINPDLTIYLSRYPTTEWVAIDAVTHPSDRGVGFAEAAIYDEEGRIGRSIQSLLFDRP